MTVRLLIPAVLRRYSDGAVEAIVEARNVREALGAMFVSHPALEERVLDARGELFSHLLLFRNGVEVARDALDGVSLADGDELDLIGAAEGGAPVKGEHDDVRMRGFRERTRVEVALEVAVSDLPNVSAEPVPVAEAGGRVLAQDIVSTVNVPPFRRSAMDGFAVVAEDTFGASLFDPVRLQLVGEAMPARPAELEVTRGTAVRIMTGAPVPKGANAVLRAEDAEGPMEIGENVLVRVAVPRGRHVGEIGEDVQTGDRVLTAGRRLRPQDCGLLAALGVGEITVRNRPRVRVLVTGNELLKPGAAPRADRIIDSNSPMLANLVRRDGGEEVDVRWLPDDRKKLRAALSETGAELVLISGGSSVGREDHAPGLVAELGELEVHGLALRPASPTGIGRIGDAKVFLLPGNPVSCLCAYDLFVRPALQILGGSAPAWPYDRVELPLSQRITSQIGRVDYVRMRVENGSVAPLAVSGASILSSTTRAAGFALVPEDSEGLGEGESVELFLYGGETL